MKKLRALLMLFLSLQMPFNIYAMDSASSDSENADTLKIPAPASFSVGDANDLLKAHFYEEVEILQDYGCCCSDDCSCLSWTLNVTCGIIGAISLILGGGLVGGGHPAYGHDYYRYDLINSGYAMFALFFLMVITPSAVMCAKNTRNNACGRAKNNEIDVLLGNLNEKYWNAEARLSEDQVCAIASYIFDHKESLKKLDPGQALTLSLVDFAKFKSLVLVSKKDISVFSPVSSMYTIKLLQLLKKRNRAKLNSIQNIEHFMEVPALYRVLEYYLPENTLPPLDLARVFYGVFNRPNGKSYRISSSEVAPVFDSSDIQIELEETECHSRVNVIFEDILLTTTRDRLSEISKVFKMMFREFESDGSILLNMDEIRAFGADSISMDDELYRFLINFANQDKKAREALIVNDKNLPLLLDLQEAFQIKIINKKCDHFCYHHKIPGETYLEQFKFAYKFHLPENCKSFKKGLLEHMRSLDFNSEELECFVHATAEDRKDIIASLDWESLYKRFFNTPKHLSEVWERCAPFKVGDIREKILEFKNEPGSADKISWAFDQDIPKEFLSQHLSPSATAKK